MVVESFATIMGNVIGGIGLAAFTLGGVSLVCIGWVFVLDWVNRLGARTLNAYGGWRELERFKEWKRNQKAEAHTDAESDR